jgi:hypothetical protein
VAKMAKKINDDDLLLALLTTKSQTEAAEALGINKQTISRRVNKPEFKAKFTEFRKQMLDKVNTQLVNSSSKAVQVLVELMNSRNEMTRYNASSRILSLAQDYISMQDIVERLDRLELIRKSNDEEV